MNHFSGNSNPVIKKALPVKARNGRQPYVLDILADAAAKHVRIIRGRGPL